MNLFVDTSVWSMLLRRTVREPTQQVTALIAALREDDVIATTGLVLQEVLQGILPAVVRTRIVMQFDGLDWITPDRSDHVVAADLRNACRRAGVQVGTVDALLAALCIRRDLTMLSADRDLEHAGQITGLKVWRSAEPGLSP